MRRSRSSDEKIFGILNEHQAGLSASELCRTLCQHRSTQGKVLQGRPDEELLTQDIIELARQYDRYGYRPATALLNQYGWHVDHKRV